MDTQKDKATPRPWKVFVKDSVVDIVGTQAVDEILARCHSSFIGAKGLAEGKANASLIVKAVNNYDALLEACKGLVEQLEYVLETKNTMGAYSQLAHAKHIINQATK